MAYGDDPRGSNFWYQGVRYNEADPNSPGGVWRQTAALSDPNSDSSNALYYGGSRGAAESDASRARQMGQGAYERGQNWVDMTPANQSRGLLGSQGGGVTKVRDPRFGALGARLTTDARGAMTGRGSGLIGQLNALAAGDPNSQAQQQLQRGYDAANANLRSVAASTRGGPIASALAARTAQNQIAGNAGNMAVQSDLLMQQERMGAFGNLSALGGTLRQQDLEAAFANADLLAEQRRRNDAMQAEYERQRQEVARMGMQGEMNRQDSRARWLRIGYGQANAEGDAIRAADKKAVDTALGGAEMMLGGSGKMINQARRGHGP